MAFVDDQLGLLAIASWLQSVLWTIVVWQTALYFKRFQTDHLGFRLTILSLALNETLAMGSLSAWLYRACITDFGAIEKALLPGWEFRASLISALAAATYCQSYLILRYRRVSKNDIICAIFGFGIIGVAGLSFYTIYASTQLDETVRRRGKITAMTAFGIKAGLDVTIALALVIYLIKRMNTDIDRTQKILRRLAFIAVKSGTVTACLAIAVLVAVLTSFDTSNLCFLFLALLGRSYSLTLLCNINMRGSRDRAGSTADGGHNISGSRTGNKAIVGQVSVVQLAELRSDTPASRSRAHAGHATGFQVTFTKDIFSKIDV